MAERDLNELQNRRTATVSRHGCLHNAAWCGDRATEPSIWEVSNSLSLKTILVSRDTVPLK